MKKICNLFKNDKFGLKLIFFDIRIKYLRRKSIKLYSECICNYQLVLNKIGIPKTKEEIELAQKAIDGYDECVKKLESFIKYDRIFCEKEKITKE